MAVDTLFFCFTERADQCPAFLLGTWQSAPGEVAAAVQHALTIGYRHIDAAFCYQNEEEVGKGIAAAIAAGNLKREDIFVTTKLWCTYHTRVEEGINLSLKNLGLEYGKIIPSIPMLNSAERQTNKRPYSRFVPNALADCDES
jgi:diketogulonate reductase-like aldo/keto reductase